MEVMSSLLLCALVALLPQALVSGKQSIRSSSKDIKFNNTIVIQQKGSTKHKLLLNLNGQPLVVKVSELQNVFSDFNCIKCLECMERAVKAHRLNEFRVDIKPYLMELHNEMLGNAIKTHRDRRALKITKSDQKFEKKSKSRRSKGSKQVAVQKYNVDGEIRAIKVKESNGEDYKSNSGLCEVYSVSKSYPCDSHDADTILLDLKKNNKKTKRDKSPSTSTTTEKNIPPAIFRKRHIDNTQLPENIMPSNEEMY